MKIVYNTILDSYCKLSDGRTHGGPITCLSLSDSQLFLSGSSLGRVTVSDPLLDQPVATLKSTITAGGKLKTPLQITCPVRMPKSNPL